LAWWRDVYRSRVLETGGLQLDSRTEYDDLQALLGRLGPRALEAQREEMEQVCMATSFAYTYMAKLTG
jgi:hypothetical protein